MSIATRCIGSVIVSALALLGTSCGVVDAERSPATSQAESSKEAKGGDVKDLVRDLDDAVRVLSPSVRVEVAATIIGHRNHHRAMESCMGQGGMPYPQYLEPKVEKRALNHRRSKGDWFNRPSAEKASQGFGLNWTSPIEWQTDAPDPSNGMNESELLEYNAQSDRCAREFPPVDPVNWTEVVRLDGELQQIADRSVESPGYIEIRDEYAACMERYGYAISSPSDIVPTMQLTPQKFDSKGERQIAMDDLECRAPLHDRFIQLRAEDWQAWLATNSGTLLAIEEMWRQLEAEAGSDR